MGDATLYNLTTKVMTQLANTDAIATLLSTHIRARDIKLHERGLVAVSHIASGCFMPPCDAPCHTCGSKIFGGHADIHSSVCGDLESLRHEEVRARRVAERAMTRMFRRGVAEL